MEFGAEVYLNENFSPSNGNVEYYDVTGVTNYTNSFTKMMSDSDKEKFETAANKLAVGERTYCIFHLKSEVCEDDFFGELRRIDETNLYLRFFTADKITEELEKDEILLRKYKTLLSSDKNSYFDYHFDTKTVETYSIKLGHVVSNGVYSVQEWQESIIKSDFVKEDDISKFNNMCTDIEEGKSVNCLFETGNYNNFLMEVKVRPIFLNAEKAFMTGTISYVEKDAASSMEENNSDIDDLTGLYRKNAIKKIEEDTINDAIAKNSDRILAIIMVDIDNFKTVNDTYGHLFGDKVISKISSTLKEVVGKHGCCGRFGGDELCAFIDNVSDLAQVRAILRTLKTRVLNIKYPEYPSLKVTVSIGCASYPENGKSYNIIFKKADRALYIAKEKGRNRYVIYIDEIHGENLEETAADSGNSSSYITDKNEFTNFLNNISQYLYLNGKNGISEALKMIYSAFSLERVQFYELVDGRFKNFFKCGEDLEKTLEYADFADQKYFDLFENGVLTMNFVYNLEFSHPEAYKSLSGEGVFSAVQCIVKNKAGEPIGLCSFEHLSYKKMFSNNELLVYSYIANMIGVILEKE